LKVPKILRGTPAAGEGEQPRRRRRRPRSEAPSTIVPVVDEVQTPSWLHTEAPEPASSPLALGLDAARERLRRQIPPVEDDL
jgi:hypothetical protein